MALPPIITVDEADPYRRGRAIGCKAREWIDRSLQLYSRIFEHYAGLEWPRVVEHAEAFRPVIGGFDPDILAEIDGIADGAGTGRDDILALNVRSEIMFGLGAALAAECTSFFAGPQATRGGRVLLGQNWDWKPDCLSTTILLDVRQGPDAPAYITVVEAGLLAKTGLSSAGIGLTTNTLISPYDRGEAGIPYHVLLRSILSCTTLEEAEDLLTRARRSASANYMVADAAGRGLSIETWPGSPGGASRIDPVHGVIGHSNCFVCEVPFEDLGAVEIPDGPERVRVLSEMLQEASGSLDVASLHRISQTHGPLHPNGICRHPDEGQEPIARLMTVASVIYDLKALTAHVCLGNPCVNDLEVYHPTFAGEAP